MVGAREDETPSLVGAAGWGDEGGGRVVDVDAAGSGCCGAGAVGIGDDVASATARGRKNWWFTVEESGPFLLAGMDRRHEGTKLRSMERAVRGHCHDKTEAPKQSNLGRVVADRTEARRRG